MSRSNGTSITSISNPKRSANSVAMPYSKPPVRLSTSSPFQKPGAGNDVATVSTPGVIGSNRCPAMSSLDPQHVNATSAAVAATRVPMAAPADTIRCIARHHVTAADEADGAGTIGEVPSLRTTCCRSWRSVRRRPGPSSPATPRAGVIPLCRAALEPATGWPAVLISVIVLGILASLDPLRPVVFLLVLRTQLVNAIAFLVGWTLAMSLLFVIVFVTFAGDISTGPDHRHRTAASVAELAIGAALLIVAASRWRRRHDEIGPGGYPRRGAPTARPPGHPAGGCHRRVGSAARDDGRGRRRHRT